MSPTPLPHTRGQCGLRTARLHAQMSRVVSALPRPGKPPVPASISTRDTAQCSPACTVSTSAPRAPDLAGQRPAAPCARASARGTQPCSATLVNTRWQRVRAGGTCLEDGTRARARSLLRALYHARPVEQHGEAVREASAHVALVLAHAGRGELVHAHTQRARLLRLRQRAVCQGAALNGTQRSSSGAASLEQGNLKGRATSPHAHVQHHAACQHHHVARDHAHGATLAAVQSRTAHLGARTGGIEIRCDRASHAFVRLIAPKHDTGLHPSGWPWPANRCRTKWQTSPSAACRVHAPNAVPALWLPGAPPLPRRLRRATWRPGEEAARWRARECLHAAASA